MDALNETIRQLNTLEKANAEHYEHEMHSLEATLRDKIQGEKLRFEERCKLQLHEKESEKDSLQQQLRSVQHELTMLQLQVSESQAASRKNSMHSVASAASLNSNASLVERNGKRKKSSNRKRPRQQMEAEDGSAPAAVNPSKKRKVTIDGKNIGVSNLTDDADYDIDVDIEEREPMDENASL